MSENDEPTPLTRRERRLRDMAQTSGTPLVTPDDQRRYSERLTAESNARRTDAPAETNDDDIEISPVDEQGRLRTRREIRELREAALAAQRERFAATPSDEVTDSSQPAETKLAGSDVGPVDYLDEDFDARLAPTQALSVEEVNAANGDDGSESRADAAVDSADAQAAAESGGVAAEHEETTLESLLASSDTETSVREESRVQDESGTQELGDEADEEPAAEEPKKGGLFSLFTKNKFAEEKTVEEGHADAPADPVAGQVDAGDELRADDDESEGDENLVEYTVPEPYQQSDPQLLDEEADECEEPDREPNEGGYSFPDIVPLDEERSVFDDPESKNLGRSNDSSSESEKANFEDVIVRAVSDESAAHTSSTASLILPALPEDNDLSRPLGETGELYITGSFELPKSLGETGGHSRIHESIESDSFPSLEGDEDFETGESDSAPISALKAVSSRASGASGLVTPEVKKESKRPLILALSGGGLLVILVGGAVWAWSAGIFG